MFSDYKIIEHYDKDIFQDSCRKMLVQGWIPQGGVCFVVRDNGNKLFAQAFVLPEGEPSLTVQKRP